MGAICLAVKIHSQAPVLPWAEVTNSCLDALFLLGIDQCQNDEHKWQIPLLQINNQLKLFMHCYGQRSLRPIVAYGLITTVIVRSFIFNFPLPHLFLQTDHYTLYRMAMFCVIQIAIFCG
jgi:hypothetical protein